MLCREVGFGTVPDIPIINLNSMNGQFQERSLQNRISQKTVLELYNWKNYGKGFTSLIGATVLVHGIFGDSQMACFADATMIVNGWIKTWNAIQKEWNGKFM